MTARQRVLLAPVLLLVMVLAGCIFKPIKEYGSFPPVENLLDSANFSPMPFRAWRNDNLLIPNHQDRENTVSRGRYGYDIWSDRNFDSRYDTCLRYIFMSAPEGSLYAYRAQALSLDIRLPAGNHAARDIAHFINVMEQQAQLPMDDIRQDIARLLQEPQKTARHTYDKDIFIVEVHTNNIPSRGAFLNLCFYDRYYYRKHVNPHED